jgi:hypothetical protein
MNDEIYQRTFKHVMQLFIFPEIARRKAAGTLPDNFLLSQAQVLLYGYGRKPEVRLNEEAEIIASAKIKDGINKRQGEAVLPNEIELISGIRLPDRLESECAHISFVNYGGRWLFGFDFRYNKKAARKHFDAAKQFYEVADFSQKNRLILPFVDNLFSCVELLAKAELLLVPDFLKKKTTHKDIQTKYGRFVDMGNAKPDFKATLNKLSGLRVSARYLRSELRASDSDVAKYLAVANEMIRYIESKLAKI